MKNLCAVLVVLFSLNCASAGTLKHAAALSIKTAESGLALADETEELLVCGKITAVEGHCIDAATHRELTKKFISGFKYVEEAKDLYVALPEGPIRSQKIGALATKVADIVLQILADLPDSKQKTTLVKTQQIKTIKESK
jgi:hypothetical protein